MIMRKFYYLLIFLFLFVSTGMFAQQAKKIVMGDNGSPRLIQFDTKLKAAPTANSKEVLKSYLSLQAKDDFKLLKTEKDMEGFEQAKYQQYFNGIPVEYGVYKVHSKNGVIQAISGDFKRIDPGLSITPKLTEKQALDKALSFIGAKKYMWQDADNETFAKSNEKAGTYYPKGELVVVQNFLSTDKDSRLKPTLAYKFNIYAQRPHSRDYVYVDASTGEIVQKDAIIKQSYDYSNKYLSEKLAKPGNKYSIETDVNGNAATRYSGSRAIVADSYNGSYRLRESARGIQTYNMKLGINYNSAVDFTDNDNNWTSAEFNNTAKDNAALDAHWGAEMVRDYWSTVHGRNSFDNNGAITKNYVHFDLVEYGYPDNDNAFWDGSVMTYGDGTSFQPLTCIDVVAHEIGHAVMENTANLTYSYESGAMNEGFSDIWGSCIEYYAAPTKSTWLVGEEIGGPIRSFSNPNAYGQPDTYHGTNWYTGSSDNGGVHYNSGVLNKWFYILTVGESGTNDNGHSYSVTGIGIDKAAKIAYRVESVYLTANSQYADARTFAIQAAEDLYGVGSNEVIQVTNAMAAVGIGGDYCPDCIEYCASAGTTSSYEWIAKVQVGSFSNSSTQAGYTDFTSKTINVNAGQTYAITLTPGFASTTYNEYWKIWIDYNKDGDFSDANELVFDAGAMSKTAVSGNIVIPSMSSISTRMRVSMKYNGAQTNCEAFSYGEVEDYTVAITGGTADTQAPTAPGNLASSNVTTSGFTLGWTASTDNVGVTGYRVYQNNSLLATVTSTSTNISSLSAGTTYQYYVTAIDAAGNVSAASTTLSVTTLSDTQAPTAPTNLAASNIAQTSLTLSWTASTDNIGVTGYRVYKNSSLLTTVTSTTTSITGLTPSTTYQFYVTAIDAAGNVSAASSTISATTLTNSVTYCASKGSNVTYEWIDLVKLGSINNVTSSNAGYGNFTNLSTNLGRNTSYTINFSAGFKSTAYTEYWVVWIDYNQDGDFLDTGEKVASGSSSSSGTLSKTFTVPSTATLGSTRMRVTMKYNAAPTSCETFSYGEVEDYTVVIGTTGIIAESFNADNAEELGNENADYILFPNPAKDHVKIRVPEQGYYDVRIYNTRGKLVKTIILDGINEMNISDLKSGMYTIQINDGRKLTARQFIKE
jgi:bacillolysin